RFTKGAAPAPGLPGTTPRAGAPPPAPPRLFEVAEAVYASVTRRTGLPVNVDFFSAVVYDALGIPPDFCTSIFATARVAGWCAHALEQYADNRLIRPRPHYVGPAPRPLVRSPAAR